MIPIEALEKMIELYTWEDFEATEQGRILVVNRQWGSIPYFMRVGLHLNRATQAIMACGQFLRMRPVTEGDGWRKLKKLYPSNPNACLYRKERDYHDKKEFNPSDIWDPRPSMPTPQMPGQPNFLDKGWISDLATTMRTDSSSIARLQRKYYEGKS